MPSEKRYTEEEARAIFKRATERHEEARRAEESSRAGLTLEELQHIGAEAGIDPEHIATAATDLTRSPAPDEKKTFLGMPTVYRASRTIPFEVSDEAWEKIVPELQRFFGKDGIPGQIGRVRTWQLPPDRSSNSDRPVTLTVTSERTGTRVEIEQNLKGTAIGLTVGAAGLAIVGGLLAIFFGGHDIPIGIAMMFALFAIVFFGATWGGMRIHFRAREKKFEDALNQIKLIARTSRAEKSGTTAEARTRPQVDLDALPDEPESERDIELRDRERTE